MTEKEKQIDEMARCISTNRNACFSRKCEECALSTVCLYKEIAASLYMRGYRKQIECEDVSRFRGVFECSECHWTDEDIGTADPIRFCAGCGAKVKGGDE